MKKLSAILVGMLFFLVCISVKAQDKPKDYFVGKWDLVVEGTPSGDGKMSVAMERKDGKLTGVVSPPGKPEAVISRVEEKEKSVTLYFNTGGYDVYLFMEKKDEDNVTGSMMDMFDAKGKRVIETKK